jgi:3-deoxy-D-manno-octulosonic-acid transferase
MRSSGCSMKDGRFHDHVVHRMRCASHGTTERAGALVKIHYAAYNALLPIAELAARMASPFNAKIADGLKGREGFRERWTENASALERRGPLIWFHVSSVGEFEQAKPVMNLLAEKTRPVPLGLALTFYSPSGMNYYQRHDRSKRMQAIKFLDYLPVDTTGNVRFCLDTLKPDMLVFVKFDLWPNLIIEASRRRIPQILISGTLSPDSHRLSWPARRFYGSLYAKLSGIAAISEEDAGRFVKDGGGAAEIIVAGDTRFDQVCQRIDASTVTLPEAIHVSGRRWIIAGSTWPKDEEVVLPGFARLRAAHPDCGLMLVPHEPTRERLMEIGEALRRTGLPYRLLSTVEDKANLTEPVVVVDGVGYLAELYRCGVIAYVGGSFTTGVHNVMEPAVLGLPVFFGPRIDNSFEARNLADLGSAGIVITSEDFAREIGALLENQALLAEKGHAAKQFIRNHCGAALRCVALIEKYLEQTRPLTR